MLVIGSGLLLTLNNKQPIVVTPIGSELGVDLPAGSLKFIKDFSVSSFCGLRRNFLL